MNTSPNTDDRTIDFDRVDELVREARRMRSEYMSNAIRAGFRRIRDALRPSGAPAGLASRGA